MSEVHCGNYFVSEKRGIIAFLQSCAEIQQLQSAKNNFASEKQGITLHLKNQSHCIRVSLL